MNLAEVSNCCRAGALKALKSLEKGVEGGHFDASSFINQLHTCKTRELDLRVGCGLQDMAENYMIDAKYRVKEERLDHIIDY